MRELNLKTKKMNLSELLKMDETELRNLNNLVVQAIKIKRKTAGNIIKNEMAVGASVTVNHPKLRNQHCEVTKINRTKVIINGQYSVPLSMISLK